jgi:hypothetical protein
MVHERPGLLPPDESNSSPLTRRPPKTSPLGRLLELRGRAVREGASTAATYVGSLRRSAPRKEALRTAELVKNAHRLVATLG